MLEPQDLEVGKKYICSKQLIVMPYNPLNCDTKCIVEAILQYNIISSHTMFKVAAKEKSIGMYEWYKIEFAVCNNSDVSDGWVNPACMFGGTITQLPDNI